MLKLSIIELILRLFPEVTLEMFSVYVLSSLKFDLRRIFLSGGLLAVALYIIRLFPIQFGIHTIIFSAVLILISIHLNKIDVKKAIAACLISVMNLAICDGLSFFVMTSTLEIDFANIMSNPLLKILYGLPSLLLYACIIFIIYKIMHRRRVSKGVEG